MITDNMIGVSFYATGHKAEGWVVKNESTGVMTKVVRLEFKEKNIEAFGMSPKQARSLGEEERIAAMFCTNARIDKAIFKLLDDGNTLEMALMKHLPMNVYIDMWEEHWREIVTDRNLGPIEPQALKKIITGRCKAVLNQHITNQALQHA